jgi:hypothetical protein
MPTVQPIQFDDTTNKQGICQDIDFLCCSNPTSFPKSDKVRLVNLGLDSVCDLIQTVDTNWKFEDLGQTDLPIGYMDWVAGQQDYSLDNAFLSISGVWENITPTTGTDTWKELVPLDKDVFNSNQFSSPLLNATRGYFINGNSIYFKPSPLASTTGNNSTLIGYGFKVLFQRSIKYVATDATTITLGYSPLFYRLAALYAARDYAMVNSLDQLNAILQQIVIQENRLKQNYGRRNKTQHNRFSVRQESNK